MTCLETTFLVDLIKGRPEVESIVKELQKNNTPITITAPSIMELWSGAAQQNYPQKKKEKIRALCESVTVLHLDATSAREAGELEAQFKKEGTTLHLADLMIAAIAKANNETLLTRDAHYARIPGLRVLKY
jgi:tRNA(fMet)-specific endonuclease VapC